MMLASGQTSLVLGFGKYDRLYPANRPVYVAKLQPSTGDTTWFKVYHASDDELVMYYTERHSGGEDSDGNIAWMVADDDSIWIWRIRASDGGVLSFAKAILNNRAEQYFFPSAHNLLPLAEGGHVVYYPIKMNNGTTYWVLFQMDNDLTLVKQKTIDKISNSVLNSALARHGND